MRILDDEKNRPVNRVWAYLTPSEAEALYEMLKVYFEEPERDADWHGHVEDEGGADKELTLAIYAPDGSTGKNEKWARWFRDNEVTDGMFGPPTSG